MAKHVRRGLIPFWMLNDGSTVKEKIEYVRACKAGGISALVMHSRSGNLIPYASTEWFEMIRDIVEEGKRLDMDMWLYDEDPYPSGAAGGMVMEYRPDLKALALERSVKPADLKEGQLWYIGQHRVMWAGLVPAKEALPARDHTGLVGTIRNDWFMGRWHSRFYYEEIPVVDCPRGDAIRQQFVMRVPKIPRGYDLIAITAEPQGEEGSWGSLPDLLNYETFGLFCELSLNKYEVYVGQHFGKTIPGVFTDEAKAHGALPMTKDLFESFEQVYGYSLHQRLYQLFGAPLSDEYVMTRIDYRRWVGERFLDAFIRPYRQYCDKRKLFLVGHVSPEDDPIAESVTVGSVMPIMKEFSFPGTDIIVPQTGTKASPTLNLGSLRVGSLKAQWQHPCTTSESLGLSLWTATSRKSRQIYAWQIMMGIDRFFTHGFFNSNEGVVNYEAPPDFGPYSSLFRGTCAIDRWIRDLESTMDGARDFADVGIVNSMLSYWATVPGGSEEEAKGFRRSLWQSVLSCLRTQVGIHAIDENDLNGAGTEEGNLVVGKHAYRTILVPAMRIVPEGVLKALRNAASRGVRVFWFGNGPERRMDSSHRLKSCPKLPGKVLALEFPDDEWCEENLSSQVILSGKGNRDCYVRRFVGRDRSTYCFAVNMEEKDALLSISAEDGNLWVPVCIDGDADVEKERTRWRLPSMGSGLFKLGKPPRKQQKSEDVVRRETGTNRKFKRDGVNILRLNTPEVIIKGRAPVHLTEPKPYWQISDDFSARTIMPRYIGDVPVTSRVFEADLRYVFAFSTHHTIISNVKLVLDPRCARGIFRVFLNGKAVDGEQRFPLECVTPVTLVLRGLRSGENRLEIRFKAVSAMDGLLSQLYLEGNFDVDVSCRAPVIEPVSRGVSEEGWQASGLPHYMGDGVYEWREKFSADDLTRAWSLEVDDIVDSAELFVNGESMGTRAWRDWRWLLSDLKDGTNILRLVVSGTAGNKHEIDWPNQPQGWIGKATLVGERK